MVRLIKDKDDCNFVKAIRSIMVQGTYTPPRIKRGDKQNDLADLLAESGWTLREMSEVYVKSLYRKTPVLSDLARHLQVDSRTVKRYLDSPEKN